MTSVWSIISTVRPGVVIGLCWFVTAAPAQAQGCQGPAGNSAVSQYCEAIPEAETERTASGESVVRGEGDRPTIGQGPRLSPETVRDLRDAGPNGRTLIDLAGETAARAGGPDTREGTSGRAESEAEPNIEAAPKVGDVSALRTIASAVQSGATVGGGFIWFLLLGTVFVCGAAWTHYRRDDES